MRDSIHGHDSFVIVKTKSGYQVKSEGGKNLSSKDLSEEEAKKRLKQVEYFKRWAASKT